MKKNISPLRLQIYFLLLRFRTGKALYLKHQMEEGSELGLKALSVKFAEMEVAVKQEWDKECTEVMPL